MVELIIRWQISNIRYQSQIFVDVPPQIFWLSWLSDDRALLEPGHARLPAQEDYDDPDVHCVIDDHDDHFDYDDPDDHFVIDDHDDHYFIDDHDDHDDHFDINDHDDHDDHEGRAVLDLGHGWLSAPTSHLTQDY